MSETDMRGTECVRRARSGLWGKGSGNAPFYPVPNRNCPLRFFCVALWSVLAIMVLGANTETVHAVNCDSEPVFYKVTFQGNFNEASSPGGLPDPVQFTQLVWVTHNSKVKFWEPGGLASRGVESVAEEGSTYDFTNEIIFGARGKYADTDFFPNGRYPGGEETLSFPAEFCKAAPLFTLLSMLDLSPDWFVGLSSYSLLDGQGNWISSATVDLYPYDAGTEQGTEYSLNNPPTRPHQPITSIRGQGKFSGSTVPVAKITFKRINPVSLSVNGKSSARVTEGDAALRITARLASRNTSGGALSIPMKVRGHGTTAQSDDYTVANSISIASDARSGAATFAVTEDSTDEPNEKVVVEFGTSLPGIVTTLSEIKVASRHLRGVVKAVTTTIVDNDATIVSLVRSDTGAVAEGAAGAKENAEFTVTLSRALVANERIDVPLVLSGTGITVDDLEGLSEKSGGNLNTGVTLAGAGTLTPTVIFKDAGARTATLVLTPGDDDYVESDETLTVALGPDGNGANGFDRDDLLTNVGGGANPHSGSRGFDVVIESEDVPVLRMPVVSVSGGSAVTEGGAATFTLSAAPAPAADITVKISVVQSGDFARSGETGTRSVTIGSGGTASLAVMTVDDSIDEPDGAVTATLATGDGYSMGSPNSASVTVSDNDDPPLPVVSISGGSAVTEGGAATFTLSAAPAPAADITVKISVVQSGDFARSGETGTRSVTIGSGGTASLAVMTVDDSIDEPDGAVTATLATGNGYITGSPNSVSVTVRSDDTPVVSISGGSAVTEGGAATFTLSAAPAPAADITVKISVVQSGDFARSGETGTRSVTIGSGGTANLAVMTVDDSIDEPDGVIYASILSSGQTYSVSSTEYTASVAANDDDGTQEVPDDNDNLSPSTVNVPDSIDEPSPDRETLVAIYNATAGGEWIREDNWNSDAPVTIWYGIIAVQGRVTGLELVDNGLEGRIPLEHLESLESLEELALWGNEELAGTIPDELGTKVDRAALRKIKDVNGVSVLADWFAGDFDYSDWSGVEANEDDRVTGLDLSGVGLSGDITEAVWELSALEYLDLSDNPDLSGEIPLAVMNEAVLYVLDISETGVCVPQNQEFRQWLDSIDFTPNENCGGGETAPVSTTEPPRTAAEPVAQGEGGGGGCSVAPGGGFGRSVPEFSPGAFALLIIFLSGRRRVRRANRVGIKGNSEVRCPLR